LLDIDIVFVLLSSSVFRVHIVDPEVILSSLE